MIPALLNSFFLLLISAVHFYWAFGGRWASHDVTPKRSDGSNHFQPNALATIAVAILIGGMAFFYLYKIGWLSALGAFVPAWLNEYGLWLLASIFLLRAIGEFRYVGFFKRVRNSRFAELDTKFYSPLCLLLSLNTLLLIFFLSKS